MACGLDPLHVGQALPDAVPVNLFALVGYIPDPLGVFLDTLRCKLVPGCRLRSHVSFLPPRPIAGSSEQALKQISATALTLPDFRIDIGQVEVFADTNVIYLGLSQGAREMHSVHGLLNCDALYFSEPFVYHPHITLAQKFPSSELPRLRDIALREWDRYKDARGFDVEAITFVQNNLLPGFDTFGVQNNQWIDLADCRLASRT